jgi:hypothetical protein
MDFGERMRMAGQALMDNDLTTGWQKAVDRYVTSPIGRRLASDADLQQGVADMTGDLPMPEGGLHPLQFEVLKRVTGDQGLTAEKAYQVMSDAVPSGRYKNVAEAVQDQVFTYLNEGGVSRDTLSATAAQLARELGGRAGLTPAGTTVRQFGPGSPVAAYGAVLGGGALGVKGVMDVISRMQAGQPVTEEEAAAVDAVLKSQPPA